MSLKLPYKKFPDGKGGFTFHAILHVNIALPEKNAPRSKRVEAIIDSGASRCIFHASLGRAIGLQIDKGEVEETRGVSGEVNKAYLHNIHLYAPGGIIPIRAAFSERLPVACILGMIGFFEHFKVTFDPTGQRVEIERIFQA